MKRIYEDEKFTGENRLPPRSYCIPGGVSRKTDLCGKWRFAYFENETLVPPEITGWDTIDVPSCWQLKGYGSPNYQFSFPLRSSVSA